MSVVDEMEKLLKYRETGVISEDEFQRAKKKLLEEHPSRENPYDAFEKLDTNSDLWSACIHFSFFAGYFFPLAGFVLPIIIWQLKKQDSDFIDQHGRIVANWVISSLLGYAFFGVLSFLLIGIPFVVIIFILGIIFPILGGANALRGNLWNYPITISFFPVSKDFLRK